MRRRRPASRPAPLDFCSIGDPRPQRDVLGQLVGAGNYDIGHLALGTDGGGVAGLGVVGGAARRVGCTGIAAARSATSTPSTTSRTRWATSSAATTRSTASTAAARGGNRNRGDLGRARQRLVDHGVRGICGQDDLQPHSDPYFSQRSLDEITAYTRSRQPADNEVQTVGAARLRHDGDSFTLSYPGADPARSPGAPTTRRPGSRRRSRRSPGCRPGGDRDAFGAFTHGPLDDTGFQVIVRRRRRWPAQDVPALARHRTTRRHRLRRRDRARAARRDNPGVRHARPATTPPVGDARPPPSRSRCARRSRSTRPATDADGDPLTYLWEQNDVGGAAARRWSSNTKRNGPLFRQFRDRARTAGTAGTYQSPSPGENRRRRRRRRVFPDLAQVLGRQHQRDDRRLPGRAAAPSPGPRRAGRLLLGVPADAGLGRQTAAARCTSG